MLDLPTTAPGIAEVDYYAHRELGPADRVLHSWVIDVRATVLDAAHREAIWEEQKARDPGLVEHESGRGP